MKYIFLYDGADRSRRGLQRHGFCVQTTFSTILKRLVDLKGFMRTFRERFAQKSARDYKRELLTVIGANGMVVT